MKRIPWLAALRLLFIACLIVRFAYAFWHNPLDTIYSDPLRHWNNGLNFFHPNVMGSIDPFLYQLFIYGLQQITGASRAGVALYIGLLSAAMPWCWYKALREMLPRALALAGGIVIALMPSLWQIYSFFMSETLLLPLMGSALWLSLRAVRKRDLPSWAWAGLVWTLACYTRPIALPMALITLGISGLLLPKKMPARVLIVLLLGGALAVPAAWHSSLQLHYYAPFGTDNLNRVYRESQTQGISLAYSTGERWGFISPGFYHMPLAPFSQWKPVQEGSIQVFVDLEQGRRGWDAAHQQALNSPRVMSWSEDMAQNITMLFFDPSWPDDQPSAWLSTGVQFSRWLWLPLFLYVLRAAFTARISTAERIVPLTAIAVTALLCVQNAGVMEGRYRKPVEPWLIASAFILAYRQRRPAKNENGKKASIRLRR